jgi:hypothetical protein
MENIDAVENEARMLRGELYYAFTQNLIATRKRWNYACRTFNQAEGSRRKLVELWKA